MWVSKKGWEGGQNAQQNTQGFFRIFLFGVPKILYLKLNCNFTNIFMKITETSFYPANDVNGWLSQKFCHPLLYTGDVRCKMKTQKITVNKIDSKSGNFHMHIYIVPSSVWSTKQKLFWFWSKVIKRNQIKTTQCLLISHLKVLKRTLASIRVQKFCSQSNFFFRSISFQIMQVKKSIQYFQKHYSIYHIVFVLPFHFVNTRSRWGSLLVERFEMCIEVCYNSELSTVESAVL